MKILLTLIFIVISQSIFASDVFENLDEWNKWFNANKTTLAGEMSCKITDQIIMEVKEGKPKRYSHYNNKPKVGDKLSLIYQTFGEKIKLQLKHPLEEQFNMSINAEKVDINSKIASFYNSSETLKYFHESFTLRKDSLDVKYFIIAGGFSLYMKRYYKNDWEGVFTSNWGQQIQIITLDCRTITDKIDEIIERYNTYPGKLKFKKNSK